MQYVYILQCGLDVVFCTASMSAAYKKLSNQLTNEQSSGLISYMSLTRLFNREHMYVFAIPFSVTWVIKKMRVHKKGEKM